MGDFKVAYGYRLKGDYARHWLGSSDENYYKYYSTVTTITLGDNEDPYGDLITSITSTLNTAYGSGNWDLTFLRIYKLTAV